MRMARRWRWAVQPAVASSSPSAVALKRGNRLADQHNNAKAKAAYQETVAPRAANALGQLLADEGDTEGARRAFQIAIDSRHFLGSAIGWVNLGNLLFASNDIEGYISAYQQAVKSGHFYYAPKAAASLGHMFSERGQTRLAQNNYELAVYSNHPEAAPEAAVYLGALLLEQGDRQGAKTILRRGMLERGDALLAELRTLAEHHPDDAAVRELLANGLFNALFYSRQEGKPERSDVLLTELRTLAEHYPGDAVVRELLAKLNERD
jgi:tetratricopeptide (TPR) repeat protein